ncbi:MAG: hypothetical protein WCG25_06765 [bacterium]
MDRFAEQEAVVCHAKVQLRFRYSNQLVPLPLLNPDRAQSKHHQEAVES